MSANPARRTPTPPFSQTLPILLLRAREAVIERFRPLLQAHDLSEQQWRVLRTLSGVEAIEVTPLARAVFVRGPSLSRILKDMLARGLISRRPGVRDRRQSLISITPAGRDMIRAVGPDALKVGQEISRLFGDERMEKLRGLLVELEQTVGRSGG